MDNSQKNSTESRANDITKVDETSDIVPETSNSDNTDKNIATSTEENNITTQPDKDWHDYIPKLFTVSPSPHIRTEDTTRSIMADVCIALLPALIWGIYLFGFRALTITLVSVIFSVMSEFVFEKALKKPLTVSDFSAVVTGMLVGMNLPVSVPLWMPAVGAVFAIIVVKQLFGGIGKNFMNPALAARVFLFAWPSHMGAEAFISPGVKLSPFAISVDTADAISSATPLSYLKNGDSPDISLFDMILGNMPGCIGEVSALLLTVGFLYLLIRRVISWKIPILYIGTVAVVTFIASKTSLPFEFAAQQILSGGLFLGAIFMATDYTTSPMTERGKTIYAIGCGLLTVFIRYFGGYAEGVSFSILIMNLLVWYLDRYTKPVRFGGGKNE